MNVYAEFETRLTGAIERLEKQGVLPAGTASCAAAFEPARQPGRGDLVTKAPLTLARAAGMEPRRLAGLLAAGLQDSEEIEHIDIGGAGFINLTLTASFWTGTLARILAAGADYGRPAQNSDEPVCVGCLIGGGRRASGSTESITASGLRSILTADALANLLEFAGRRASRELAVQLPRAAAEAAMARLSLFGVHHDIVFFEQPQQGSDNENRPAVGEPKANPPRETGGGRASFKLKGEFTTFAFQLAYYRDRLVRGCKRMITVLGADQYAAADAGAAIRTMSGGNAGHRIKVCQQMRITNRGEPVEILDKPGHQPSASPLAVKAGPNALRFMTLFCRENAALEFDLDDVADQSWDNPVFYTQYAHARACSALRNLQEDCTGLNVGEKLLSAAHLHLLTDQAELSVIKRLSQFPRVIEFATKGYEPQRIALFLYELAGAFHALWKRSKESPQLRFNVHGDRELTRARGALVSAVVCTMQTGFGLLGVKAVSEMR